MDEDDPTQQTRFAADVKQEEGEKTNAAETKGTPEQRLSKAERKARKSKRISGLEAIGESDEEDSEEDD